MPGENSRDDFAAAIADLEKGDAPGRDTSITDADPIEPGAVPGEREAAGRDDKGRYAPKTAAKDPVAADTQSAAKEGTVQEPAAKDTSQQTQQLDQKTIGDRAPASWKPEEREGWETMTQHHKAAVLRREREVDEALRMSSDARRGMQEFQRIAAPYEVYFRAENVNALQAVENLFQTAAVLRTAPAGQKAALVADLVHQYGIDVTALDSALTARMQGRQAPTAAHDPVLQAIDQRMKPVNDFMQSLNSQRQSTEQQLRAEAEQTWATFSTDQQNEFANDLRQDMADIMELATRRGQPMGLPEAYRRAMLAHPTISAIVERRTQATGAAQQTAAARRAQEASASLPQNGGAPSQDGGEESDGTVGGDLRSAIRQLSRSSGR